MKFGQYLQEDKEIEYKNPWFGKGNNDKDMPRSYKTSVKPEEYKGFHIYHRIKDESDPTFKLGKNIFDIVYQGKLVSQMAGPNGAKKAIDTKSDEFKTFAQSQLKEDTSSQKMVDTAFKKAEHDINKDNPPVNIKAAAKMGITEDGTTRKIKIEVDMVRQGTKDAMSYEDVEKIIASGFKRLKLGTKETSYVNLYDDSRDIKVGSLEVK